METSQELDFAAIQARTHELMPRLVEELEQLVRIPSISGEGQPDWPLRAAHDLVMEQLRASGVEDVRSLEIPDTQPLVYAEIPGPEGAPTVLLYSHYDVVGAGDESAWDSPAFEPVIRDGAMYGRGSADTKSNILAHIGAIRAWGAQPPVTIKVIIEGEEEVGGGQIHRLPELYPGLIDADVIIIGDMGSIRPGVPTHTVSLRGMANVDVEVRTLASPQHSGQFGGAAPDALIALVQALATLHDADGNVAVDGLLREPWVGDKDEALFRELATIVEGMPLQGTGDLGSRVWSGPAITVIGLDSPSVDGALNAVQASARARINVRVHPKQAATDAQAAVIKHLEATKPFGVQLTVSPGATGEGFAANIDHPVYELAREAWSAAWDEPVVQAGVGGSIPLVNTLQHAAPDAAVLLVGTSDGLANIHGPNERVVLDEFERAVVAEAHLFGLLASNARA